MILAAGLGAAALFPAPANAQHVAVVVKSNFAVPNGAAVGLLVAGRGKTVGPDQARDALNLGALDLCNGARCSIRVFVSIPAAEHHNVRRYEIAIVGGGYRGLLVSDRTKIPGLVSIYDIAPTVRALDRGQKPAVTSRDDPDPETSLRKLDRRLAQAHDARGPASYVIFGLGTVFALLTLAFRSSFFGRAALFVGPVGLGGALALSGLGIARPQAVGLALLAITGLGPLAVAALIRSRWALAAGLLSIFVVYFLVLVFSTETSSLAALGPHPDGGVRFYGISNQVETLLLVSAILGGGLLGSRFLPLAAAVVLVVVGASRIGADGGGVLVFAAGYLFLWLRLRRVRLTARNVALGVGAVVAGGLILVGLDAMLGGSSHVTRAIGDGPVALAGELAHRWRISLEGFVSSWHATLIISASLALLAWLAVRRPRYATVDAVLVALAVSLLVNDSPRDVAAYGALSCAALRFWKDIRRVE